MASQDDEFVVPHMDLSCLQNSIAYQKVLEEPWTYLHNWDSLTPSVQQEVAQNFLSELSSVKTEMAITQGVFDPSMFVNQDVSCDTADQANLEEVREETEWEQCSRNPDVARFVKTRNLVERNRLQSLRSQLDKQLEWELKRLSLERREFADVLENLRKRHEKVDQRNVRTLKNNLNSNVYICERNRKHDRYLNSINMNDILPKGLFNSITTSNTSSTNSSSLTIPKVVSSPDITKLLNTRNNNKNNNNSNKHLNPIPTIHTETSNSTEKVSKPNIYHLFYTDSGEWIHLNKPNLNISAPSSASKSSASSKGMKYTKSWSENE